MGALRSCRQVIRTLPSSNKRACIYFFRERALRLVRCHTHTGWNAREMDAIQVFRTMAKSQEEADFFRGNLPQRGDQSEGTDHSGDDDDSREIMGGATRPENETAQGRGRKRQTAGRAHGQSCRHEEGDQGRTTQTRAATSSAFMLSTRDEHRDGRRKLGSCSPERRASATTASNVVRSLSTNSVASSTVSRGGSCVSEKNKSLLFPLTKTTPVQQ